MHSSLLQIGLILSKTKNYEVFPGMFLTFPPLNMGMEVGYSPFPRILYSFPELFPRKHWNPEQLGIRIPEMIQSTKHNS